MPRFSWDCELCGEPDLMEGYMNPLDVETVLCISCGDKYFEEMERRLESGEF